jgi:hypothetical protein
MIEMKKMYKLKKEVKGGLILAGILLVCAISICSNFNNVSKDDLGNTCRGGLVKVCSAE